MVGRTTIATSLLTFAWAGVAASAHAAEPLTVRTFLADSEAVAGALIAFVLTGTISSIALLARHPNVARWTSGKMAETSASGLLSSETSAPHTVKRRRPLLDTKLSDMALEGPDVRKMVIGALSPAQSPPLATTAGDTSASCEARGFV